MKKTFLIFSAMTFFFTLVLNAQVVELKSGVKYKDEVKGAGVAADSNKFVTFSLVGWFVKDSVNVFGNWESDTTKEKFMDTNAEGQEVKITLLTGGLNPAIESGIIGMKPGGKRQIFVPSVLLAQEQKNNMLPPKTDIKLVVELKEVKEVKMVQKWVVEEKLFNTTPTGLKYAMVKVGQGPKPKAGDTVEVHYSGFLLDGKKFDSSVERDDPIKFVLGQHQVIAGWDEGIALLNKGAKAQFVIPASLAYGDKGAGNVIPPKAILVFDVELISINGK
ncbi:MAG: FKBP-type peptidyl-prolyl cis-trans isomerase [Bacteroidota bacterium]|nr:FKBP-type peptidyl-prolyl cis-trans isomerase [Bacteroidota bacterium]